VINFTPRPLYPQGKSPWYPLDRRIGGPQSRSGRGGEEKNSQTPPGLEPPIMQPVVQCYPGSWCSRFIQLKLFSKQKLPGVKVTVPPSASQNCNLFFLRVFRALTKVKMSLLFYILRWSFKIYNEALRTKILSFRLHFPCLCMICHCLRNSVIFQIYFIR